MKIEVEGHPLWAFNAEINLPIYDNHNKREVVFKLPIEDHLPQDPFLIKLSDDQIAGLWYIAENTFFLEYEGCPGWLLAKKLEMPHGHVSSRVTTPLKKMGLINSIARPTTNPKSSHPGKKEKAWFIERASMKNAFAVLYSIFQIRDFNNLIGPEKQTKINSDSANEIDKSKLKEPKQGDPIRFTLRTVGPLKFHSPLEEEYRKKSAGHQEQKEKIHANTKLLILAYLQKRIEEYEYSTQYFIDMGVKPPIGVSSKADFEKAEADLSKAFENK
jgi:hypothetical protein